MAARVPRLIVIGFVAVLATAGLTYGAEQKLAASPVAVSTKPLVQQRATLTVPDVRNQAFVFAKGSLQDAGLAWRVSGAVRGYPANTVVSQTPPAGSRVFDTGAPVVTVTLVRNKKYPQQGTPADVSPYRATATLLAEAAAQPLQSPPSTTTPTTPAATTPAATTPATTTSATTTPAAASRYPQSRPPAFSVAGAPKEPLDELPLVDRTRALDRWLTAHPKPSDAIVRHWLYQNEWIVTGARFGWWRGADALRILVRVDRRAQALWGIGSKSESVAAGALAEVEARSR